MEEGFARKQADRQDRFEREALAFHHRVREGYLKLAADEPERWLIIDAGQPKKKIADIIWQRVRLMISKRRG